MATGNITVTTSDKHIDDVWVEGVIRALMFETVIAENVDRSWDFVGHGDTYHKARFPNIESQSKSASVALDAYVYTDTEQTISINVHTACAIKIEDIAKVLSRDDQKAHYQKNMGYSLARAIDVDLAGLAQSFSQTVGTYGLEVTYDNLLESALKLEIAGYNMSDNVRWMFSPALRMGLMKMDTFIHASYVGDDAARAAHDRAKIGSFLGAPLTLTNLLRAPASGQHDNFLFHKEMIALVMAQEPKTTVDRIGLDLADVVVMDNVYGRAEIDRYSEAAGNITATDEGAVLIKSV